VGPDAGPETRLCPEWAQCPRIPYPVLSDAKFGIVTCGVTGYDLLEASLLRAQGV
jgi:hypothetical protein